MGVADGFDKEKAALFGVEVVVAGRVVRRFQKPLLRLREGPLDLLPDLLAQPLVVEGGVEKEQLQRALGRLLAHRPRADDAAVEQNLPAGEGRVSKLPQQQRAVVIAARAVVFDAGMDFAVVVEGGSHDGGQGGDVLLSQGRGLQHAGIPPSVKI